MEAMSDQTILAAVAELRADMIKGGAELRADLRADIIDFGAELRAELGAGLTEVRGEVTQLRVAVMGRLDRVEEKLSQIRDDITVNMGAVDTARAMTNDTRRDLQELREEVSVIFRKQRRLEEQVYELAKLADPPLPPLRPE